MTGLGGSEDPGVTGQGGAGRNPGLSRRTGWFLAAGLLLSLLLAGVASNFVSGSPDGLEHAAREGCTFNADDEIIGGTCLAQTETGHQLGDSPLADYGIRGIDNEFLATGLSGVLGVLLTFAVGGGLFWLVRRRDQAAAEPGGTVPGDAAPASSGAVPAPGDMTSVSGDAASGHADVPGPDDETAGRSGTR